MTASGATGGPGGRAQCSRCGDEYKLRKDGTIRLHSSGRWSDCPGSYLSPAPHVHECVCGCRWDEDA